MNLPFFLWVTKVHFMWFNLIYPRIGLMAIAGTVRSSVGEAGQDSNPRSESWLRSSLAADWPLCLIVLPCKVVIK